MHGHPLTPMQQFNSIAGQSGIQRLAHQRVGNAVVMVFNFHVVIHMHPHGLEDRHLNACSGKLDKAGASISVNTLNRLPGSFWKARAFKYCSSGAMARLASFTLAMGTLRSRAMIQRSTTWTADSALALSCGVCGRAGRIETP